MDVKHIPAGLIWENRVNGNLKKIAKIFLGDSHLTVSSHRQLRFLTIRSSKFKCTNRTLFVYLSPLITTHIIAKFFNLHQSLCEDMLYKYINTQLDEKTAYYHNISKSIPIVMQRLFEHIINTQLGEQPVLHKTRSLY